MAGPGFAPGVSPGRRVSYDAGGGMSYQSTVDNG